MTDKSSSGKKAERDKGPLEWIVFSISLCLVVVLLGYLTYESIMWKDSPPDLHARAAPEPSPSGQNVYHVWLSNSGNETAENVKIQVILNGKDEESAELEIQFSPRGSTREGWVSFDTPPAYTDSVSVRIESYKKP